MLKKMHGRICVQNESKRTNDEDNTICVKDRRTEVTEGAGNVLGYRGEASINKKIVEQTQYKSRHACTQRLS